MNKAAAVSTITAGSEVDKVSTVDDAIGFTSSITLVVCCAASVTVC